MDEASAMGRTSWDGQLAVDSKPDRRTESGEKYMRGIEGLLLLDQIPIGFYKSAPLPRNAEVSDGSRLK